MTQRPDREAAEARARNGHLVITALRFGGIALVMLGFAVVRGDDKMSVAGAGLGGIALVMLGFAVVRGVVDLPYWAGVVLVVAGFFDFFFLPRIVARAWKARDGEGR